jgi:hypothetical protein
MQQKLGICKVLCLYDGFEPHEQFLGHITGDSAANLDLCLALTAFLLRATPAAAGYLFLRSYPKDP